MESVKALLFFAAAVAAPSFVFAQAAPKPKKPVSVSYESVIKCFPELTDEAMSFKVDLSKLKERIDSIFATDRTLLKSRIVRFRDAGGLRRLQLEQKSDPKKPLQLPFLEARWETIADDGTAMTWTAPHLKTRPTLMEINQALAKGTIESDERIDLDTKLRGMTVLTRRNQAKVVDLKFEDKPNKKVLSCEDKADFGSICICRK